MIRNGPLNAIAKRTKSCSSWIGMTRRQNEARARELTKAQKPNKSDARLGEGEGAGSTDEAKQALKQKLTRGHIAMGIKDSTGEHDGASGQDNDPSSSSSLL